MASALTIPFILLASSTLLAFGSSRLPEKHQPDPVRLGILLSLSPLASFAVLVALWGSASDAPLTWSLSWLPSMGLSAGLYLDGLGALFALLVTGIGALVTLYAGYYFKGEHGSWRFFSYLHLFMLAMLGLVLAGDVLTLFIFWEGTSISSYLLVAYKYKEEAARRGAMQALLVTGGGGIFLLVGLLLASHVAGGSDWLTLIGSADQLHASLLYPAILLLVAAGAFTKSAQFPFHFWLPGAMNAPTPASAFLHSATMVKAGIYLLARLYPAIGGTEAWFWLLTSVGMATMLAGAYLGFKQNDLKRLLAYSTISQLGVLVMLAGQETEIAFKALAVGVLAHALYKSALFLTTGIIDHETGTRDLRRLGGLRKALPFTFAITGVAGLSMAGLPPLFGFLAKETLLAAAVHPSLPQSLAWILPASAVVAGALLLAQSLLLVWETFFGENKAGALPKHDAPRLMLVAPALPALASLAIGLLPEPKALAELLAGAAKAAYGAPVKVSLALWTGITVPLLLSITAVTLGALLFAGRSWLRDLQSDLAPWLSFETLFERALRAVDRAAGLATRLQSGYLRRYMAIMLAMLLALLAYNGAFHLPEQLELTWPEINLTGELALLRLYSLVVIAGAALASIFLHRDLAAILALGTSGFAIAIWMALESAPDAALVQLVVDILSVVILTLALARLPRKPRERAHHLTFEGSRLGIARDALLAALSGGAVALLTLFALLSRPRPSAVTPFYEANAKPLAGAKDIVGAILVDFRALDTLIEISVFAVAGLGMYSLLRLASSFKARERAHRQTTPEATAPKKDALPTHGIGGGQPSSFLKALAFVSLPLTLVLAATHMMYGHDQPGDGFTAGVLASLAVSFWYLVFGYEETRRRLRWLRGTPLIAAGILLVMLSGTLALVINGAFLSNVNFGALLNLPLPAGFTLSTSFLFEVAIALAVLGSASLMINTLSHPEEIDELTEPFQHDSPVEQDDPRMDIEQLALRSNE